MRSDKTFMGTASGQHSLPAERANVSSAVLTEVSLFVLFKSDLKIKTKALGVLKFCSPLDFTSLNCNYRQVSSHLFIIHGQPLKEEVYNYSLKEWAWPTS